MTITPPPSSPFVSAAASPTAPVATSPQAVRLVRGWLWLLCGMLLVMVALGGATRLTNSGLSMVEWKPLTVLPPLTDAQWQADFDKYRQTPEYRHRNSGMSLGDYKGIFWLEYIHRLWGRLIGLVVALPLLLFALRRMLSPPLLRRMALLFVLGGAQGGLGWLMVASGLVDRPDVSHYRLAAHFLMAVLLYCLILWTALTLRPETDPRKMGWENKARAGLAKVGRPAAAPLLLLTLLGLTLLWGALVAGLDAGLVYNTFPLMHDHWLPVDLHSLPLWPPTGWLPRLLDTPAAVQFVHRMLALMTVAGAGGLWLVHWRRDPRPAVRRAGLLVAGLALAQAGLGIATLLAMVPVGLGVAHQGGALLLVSGVILLAHATTRPAPSPPERAEPAPGAVP